MGDRLRVFVVLLSLLGLWSLAAYAAPPLLLVNNRTMAPFRFVADSLDATAWITTAGVMTLRLGDSTMVLTRDKAEATVNGVTVPLDCTPFTRGGTHYVPLRFCLETFGADVVWENGQPAVVANIAQHPLTRPPLEVTEVVYPLPGTLLYKREREQPAPLPAGTAPTAARMTPAPPVFDMMTPMMKALLTPKKKTSTTSKPAAPAAKP
jgi:hypothetical protein